jgi:glycosyltransferase involved in cell wall biosynthesis
MASAMNEGFARSRGRIVIFLDSDDVLFPDAAERIVAAWEAGVAKVQYRLQVLDGEGRPQEAFTPPLHATMPTGDLRGTLLTRFCYVVPPTSGNAYDREVLAKLMPIAEEPWRLSADYYLNMLAPFHGRVLSVDRPLGFYRVHGRNNWVYFKPNVAERLAQDVRQARLVEARVRALARAAALPVGPDLGLQDPYYIVLHMGLRIIAPDRYPEPRPSAYRLALSGLRATWHRSNAGHATAGALRQRLKRSAWFGLLPMLPRPLARRLAERGVTSRREAQYLQPGSRFRWRRPGRAERACEAP